MFYGKVIGTVTATRKDDALVGKKLLVVEEWNRDKKPTGTIHIAIDSVGAGVDEIVLVVTGDSAANVFRNEVVPIDAVIVGIIDHIELYE